MTRALIVFCLYFATLPVLAQAPAPKRLSPLEQTLANAEENFIAAAKKNDADYFKRTLTDDYIFVSYDGQLYDRQEVLNERSSDSMDLSSYNLKVVVLDEATALVTYDVILQIPPEEDQGPPPRYQHWTSIWNRQNGQWKLKFQQSTPTHWGDW